MVSFGTVEQHVGESGGGEAILFNHYATTNETTYGAHWNGCQPTVRPVEGAGFVSNIRPVLQFHSGLDAIDNPGMIDALKDNYITTHQSDYQPFILKKGDEILPTALFHEKDVLREKALLHSVSSKKISDAFPTAAFTRAEINMTKYHRPLLHKIHNKDIYATENNYNGPGLWSTSYQSDYVKRKIEPAPLDINRMGIKESSGFIMNNKTVETFMGRPNSCYAADNPGWITDRPTERTSYEMDFGSYARKPVDVGNGGPKSVLNVGFTMGNKVENEFNPRPAEAFLPADKLPYGKMDALRKRNRPEYWNAYHADKYPSFTACEYTQQPHADRYRIPDASESELQKRQETGTTHNTVPLLEGKPYAPDQFVTHNMTNYYWTAPRPNAENQSYVNLNAIPPDCSGFKNNLVPTKLEAVTESMHKLNEMNHYQGKSIVKREEVVTAPQKMLI